MKRLGTSLVFAGLIVLAGCTNADKRPAPPKTAAKAEQAADEAPTVAKVVSPDELNKLNANEQADVFYQSLNKEKRELGQSATASGSASQDAFK